MSHAETPILRSDDPLRRAEVAVMQRLGDLSLQAMAQTPVARSIRRAEDTALA